MGSIHVIRVPQIDRGSRLIATTAADAALVRQDRTMIDGGIDVLGVVDLYADGTQRWWPTGPHGHEVGADVVAALKAEVARG